MKMGEEMIPKAEVGLLFMPFSRLNNGRQPESMEVGTNEVTRSDERRSDAERG